MRASRGAGSTSAGSRRSDAFARLNRPGLIGGQDPGARTAQHALD
jgi:hypothetical protein